MDQPANYIKRNALSPISSHSIFLSSSSLLPPSIHAVIVTMVKLFNTSTVKFRNFLGSGRSERNASPSPGDQSVDKPSQPPLNQEAYVSQDASLENDDDDDNWVSEDESVEPGNNFVPEDDYVEHDDYSVNTMLPSYGEATAALDNIVGNDSNAPCLCMHHQGCCRMHNSLRTPNRGLLDQPDTSSRTVWSRLWIPNTIALFPNTEVSSALTLTPVHTTMSYHLSLNHLDCVRHEVSPTTTKAVVITELSCKDSSVSREYGYYDWLSDIYFRNGTFLQRQKMQCQLSDRNKKSEYFAGCPHQSLCISPPNFAHKDGMLEIQTTVNNQPPRCASHPIEEWNSSQGRYAQIVVCTICHSDAECTLEVSGAYLKIEYTCYRDLGPGISPTHPKWLALLAGEGSPHRQNHELKLYARVWNTSRDLDRSGLREVTHQTPNGSYNVSDERCRRRG